MSEVETIDLSFLLAVHILLGRTTSRQRRTEMPFITFRLDTPDAAVGEIRSVSIEHSCARNGSEGLHKTLRWRRIAAMRSVENWRAECVEESAWRILGLCISRNRRRGPAEIADTDRMLSTRFRQFNISWHSAPEESPRSIRRRYMHSRKLRRERDASAIRRSVRRLLPKGRALVRTAAQRRMKDGCAARAEDRDR